MNGKEMTINWRMTHDFTKDNCKETGNLETKWQWDLEMKRKKELKLANEMVDAWLCTYIGPGIGRRVHFGLPPFPCRVWQQCRRRACRSGQSAFTNSSRKHCASDESSAQPPILAVTATTATMHAN